MVGDHAVAGGPVLGASRGAARRERERATRAWLEEARGRPGAVLALAAFLPGPERALVEALVGEGVPARAIARLRGVKPRAVYRAARRLVVRLRSAEYAVVVMQSDGWPPLRRRVAELCVVEGLPLRTAAERLGLTVYGVRRELAQVRAITEALRLAGRVPSAPAGGAMVIETRRSA